MMPNRDLFRSEMRRIMYHERGAIAKRGDADGGARANAGGNAGSTAD